MLLDCVWFLAVVFLLGTFRIRDLFCTNSCLLVGWLAGLVGLFFGHVDATLRIVDRAFAHSRYDGFGSRRASDIIPVHNSGT